MPPSHRLRTESFQPGQIPSPASFQIGPCMGCMPGLSHKKVQGAVACKRTTGCSGNKAWTRWCWDGGGLKPAYEIRPLTFLLAFFSITELISSTSTFMHKTWPLCLWEGLEGINGWEYPRISFVFPSRTYREERTKQLTGFIRVGGGQGCLP